MGTRLALGLLLLALLLTGTWWATGRRAPDARLPEGARPAPAGSGAVEAPADPEPAGPVSPARSPADGAASTARGAPLRGLLLVLEEDGRELPAAAARFTLSLSTDAGAVAQVVEVRDGRFELMSERAGELRVGGLVLGDRSGRFERELHPFPEDGELVLRARRLPASVLRVVDAESGGDLRAVIVLRGVPAYRGRVAPEAWTPDDVVVEGASSPLVLPEREGVERYWVGAEGYGWQPLQVDHDTGGEREARLSAAAWLEVLVEGPYADLALRVRLYATGAAQAAGPPRTLAEARPDAQGRALLRGLPQGAYELRAEVGMWYDPPHVLASEAVELVAGERARVVLHLAHELLELQPAVLAGELVLPEGHAALEVVLGLSPADGAALRTTDAPRLARSDMRSDPGRPGVLHFEAGRLTPGRYAARVDPLQFVQLFELPQNGLRDLRLVLPSLGRVEVEVVDAVSAQALALERLAWGVPVPSGLSSWSYQNEEPHAPGRFAWLAPLGPIQVMARAPGYLDADASVRVEPNGASVRLALRPLFGLRLTLRDGAATVPGEWSRSGLELRRLGEQRELERGSEYDLQLDEQAHWRVLVPEPGWYELRLPELAGFRSAAPLEVQFGPERLRELEVALERLP